MLQFKKYLQDQWMPRRRAEDLPLIAPHPKTSMLAPERQFGVDAPYAITKPHLTASGKPTTDDETEEPELAQSWELNDPYSFRGITNSYGLLYKSNINFNEI